MSLGSDTSVCSTLVLNPNIPGATYLWQNGSTGSTLTVNTTGVYWVQATINCCVLTDTIRVTVGQSGSIDLGHDTVLCAGQTMLLSVDPNLTDILWQDGSTGHTFMVTGPGTYTVQVGQGTCVSTGAITVDYTTPPVVNLGRDTTLCAPANLLLDPGYPNLPHLWHNGSAQTQFRATSSGTYWVRVGPPGCAGSDTIEVTVIELPVIDLGPDTAICAGGQLLLTLGGSFPGARWQDGTVSSTYTVTGPGRYWVTVEDRGCTASDTITIGTASMPWVMLPRDTVLCAWSDVLIRAQASSPNSVRWQDGSVGPTYMATAPRTYRATVLNACGTAVDTMRISAAPGLTITGNLVICGGQDATITIGGNVAAIVWNTGDTTARIIVPEGTYWYNAADAHGCVRSDTARVVRDPYSEDTILLPNVITPNGDGRNEMFTVFGAAREGFQLTVFNRWGMELFTTTDPKRGWTGLNGTDPVPEGTYYYVTAYRDPCGGTGETVSRQGHVTVLR